MTVFLGSGAFGEVHEGIVQNVDGEAETRVAIKVCKILDEILDLGLNISFLF